MQTWLRATRALASGIGLVIVAACGGGGGAGSGVGGGSDAAPVAESAPAEPPPAHHRLFISDFPRQKIAMLPTVRPTDGTAFDAQATLPVTLAGALAYDGTRDLLYAASGPTIAVYANAKTLVAGASPSRVIRLPAGVLAVTALQLSTSSDVLYVGVNRQYDGQVLFLAGSSGWSGEASPARTMTINDGVRALAVDIDRGLMYVANAVIGVHVFTGIDSASGVVFATRHLLQFSNVESLVLDPIRNRLYVADVFNGIRIVDGASDPAAVQSGLAAVANSRVVALDLSSDRLYVGAYDRAYVLDSARSLGDSSPIPAASVVAPSGSSIAGFAFVYP